jgi:hypothetical protein
MAILTVDLLDLKVLFLHSKLAYKGYTFEQWRRESEVTYLEFVKGKENPKSYSQWINGQIIALTC